MSLPPNANPSPASRSLLRRCIVAFIVVLTLGLLYRDLAPAKFPAQWDLPAFGKLPVLEGGRLKPVDTVARTSLMLISGRQSYRAIDGRKLEALQWFAELVLNPAAAADRRVFRIDHPDVVGLLGFHNEERKFFALREIAPHFDSLHEQFASINPESQLRSPFEKALAKLRDAIAVYDAAAYAFVPPPFFGSPEQTYTVLQRAFADAQTADPASDQATNANNALRVFASQFARLADTLHIQAIPPATLDNTLTSQWHNLGNALLLSVDSGAIDPVAAAYARLATAFQSADHAAFNATVAAIADQIADRAAPQPLHKIAFEYFFNDFAPFYSALELYFLAFLLAALSWLCFPRLFANSAFYILLISFIIHSFGMFARMYLQGRPPVTNLYSSAIFVSWGAIPICLFLESRVRNGIASAAAGILGFCTLIIAHHLSFSGDTMEMMRAVLDSNFWLATHVPTVTVGYSATFLAGFIAAIFLIRTRLVGNIEPRHAKAIDGMVYGTLCFALLFSFVGTVLGGIWADQSWGRFWGWDPKENGALMIVLWNALILHARWGKIASTTAIMQLAVVGNVITAWSWFGTNMLGVGLHSYGFMDAAFLYLSLFVLSQFAIVALGLLNPRPYNA